MAAALTLMPALHQASKLACLLMISNGPSFGCRLSGLARWSSFRPANKPESAKRIRLWAPRGGGHAFNSRVTSLAGRIALIRLMIYRSRRDGAIWFFGQTRRSGATSLACRFTFDWCRTTIVLIKSSRMVSISQFVPSPPRKLATNSRP